MFYVYDATSMRQGLLQLICAIAVIATGICSAQSADLRSKVHDALEMARPALTAHLKAAAKGATRTGELSLLVLAGIHDGIPVTDPALAAAIKKLAKGKPNQTYDIALRLIVLEACPTFPKRMELAKKDAKKLLTHRCDEGTFQYQRHPATWDLSNTQYGALGLRSADAMGIKIPKQVWTHMAREVGKQQDPHGGFGYTRQNNGWKSYPSMTAAGIAVLAICKQAVGDNYVRADAIQKQIDRGWSYLDKHKQSIGSVDERWCYYFHYGLERAAILCDVDKIAGKTDWYAEGARMFVEEQLSGGGWSSRKDGLPGTHLSGKRGDSVPTSFAILFLRRKFQKNVGPLTVNIVRLVNIGPRSKSKAIDECARQLVKRGKDAMPDVLDALRSDVVPQRQAAAQALQGIVGEVFGYDASKDREANAKAVNKATHWYLRNR
ncbi:MAG: hypothetical protein ACI9SE_004238 [Neolewinella sp.]|jgi:hypothetical protein